LYNQHSGWRVDKCSIVKEKVEVVPNKKVAVASMKVAANVQFGSADADSDEDYKDEDKECNEYEGGDTESGEYII
jgi:hypothetical protein